jgi:hypothetical protein
VKKSEQLELFDPYDDGLTFGAWIESLPFDPSGFSVGPASDPPPVKFSHRRGIQDAG